jgi:hypothetical protein
LRSQRRAAATLHAPAVAESPHNTPKSPAGPCRLLQRSTDHHRIDPQAVGLGLVNWRGDRSLMSRSRLLSLASFAHCALCVRIVHRWSRPSRRRFRSTGTCHERAPGPRPTSEADFESCFGIRLLPPGRAHRARSHHRICGWQSGGGRGSTGACTGKARARSSRAPVARQGPPYLPGVWQETEDA